MRRITIAFILLFTIFCPLSEGKVVFEPVTMDHCKIYGTVYITQNKIESDFTIFIESTESFADLVVFKMDQQLYADREGLWHITENRDFADYILYVEEEDSFADFSVFYTNTESFAGCN